MKLLKRLVQVVLVLVVVFVLGSFLLPRNVEVSRTASIGAAPEAVFPHVNSLQATGAWSPWLDIDPDVQTTFTGPETGEGNAMEWTSEHPNVGSGSQVITASVQNERVETALDFGDMGKADAFFDLVKTDAGTDITWGFTTDTGYNPIARWMGLMMDGWVGADYEKGLGKLKALVEEG